jgi:hypothetical protein
MRTRVDQKIRTFGVPLSEADFATINRFHRRFITAGLPLKFQTTGRAPQSYYPTYRDLLFETDQQGRRHAHELQEDAERQHQAKARARIQREVGTNHARYRAA